jgi:hypothetical protein
LIICFGSASHYGPHLSKWLAGLSLESFSGETIGQKIANAAHFIGADILSPSAFSESGSGSDPEEAGYVPFTTWEMIQEAHKNRLLVKPWTVSFKPDIISQQNLTMSR